MFDDESAVLGEPLSMPAGVWESAVDEALSRPADPDLSDLIPDPDAFDVAGLDPYSGWDDSLDVEVGADVDDDTTWGEAHDDAHGQHDGYPTPASHDSDVNDASSPNTEPDGSVSDPSPVDSTEFDGIGMDDSGLDGADDGLTDDGAFPGQEAGGLDWDAGQDDDWADGATDSGWPGE